MSKPVRVGLYSSLGACLTAVGAVFLISIASRSNGSAANEAGSPAQEQTSAARVETVKVTREDLKRVTESGPAELLPIEQTELHAKASGFVSEVLVDLGDRVKKGDVLAELSIPEMRAELEQKQQLVEQAKASVEQASAAIDAALAEVQAAEARVVLAAAAAQRAEAEYRFRQKEYKRVNELAEKKAIEQAVAEEKELQVESADAARHEASAKIQSAKADLSVNQSKLAKARADLKSAESGVGVAQAEAKRVAALLDYASVRAPYDGVIAQRNVHTGAYLDAKADSVPMFRIVRTDVLRVAVDIPEKDVLHLDVGDSVQVELDALPGRSLKWPIARFAPVLGVGRKVRAEVHIANPDGKLYPGMYGHASVILEDKPDALTIPAAVLGSDAEGFFVFSVEEGKAKRRRVAVGLNDGRKAEITSGLTGTEEIIASGKGTVRDGQPVLPKRLDGPAKK